MEPIALVVAGTGRMAHVRLRALLATGHVAVCGIASRRIDRARAFAAAYGCELATDDYRLLSRCEPEAVLVAVPDFVQSSVVQWAIEHGLHVLTSGLTGTTFEHAESIRDYAAERGLVVEAGCEARYKGVWECARDVVARGELGRIVAVQAVALQCGDPRAIPLAQIASSFVNPLQWIFGDPLTISNVTRSPLDDHHSDTRSMTLLYAESIVCNLLCGYVASPESASWKVAIYGTNASLVIEPSESDSGALRLNRGADARVQTFEHAPDAFVLQAAAFCASIRGRANVCRNAPATSLCDVRVAEELVNRMPRLPVTARDSASPSARPA